MNTRLDRPLVLFAVSAALFQTAVAQVDPSKTLEQKIAARLAETEAERDSQLQADLKRALESARLARRDDVVERLEAILADVSRDPHLERQRAMARESMEHDLEELHVRFDVAKRAHLALGNEPAAARLEQAFRAFEAFQRGRTDEEARHLQLTAPRREETLALLREAFAYLAEQGDGDSAERVKELIRRFAPREPAFRAPGAALRERRSEVEDGADDAVRRLAERVDALEDEVKRLRQELEAGRRRGA